MRIERLSVKNLRLYGDKLQEIVFDENKKITILLGDNGAGKTSLLYATTVLLSQFFEHFPECKKKQFTIEDVRNVSNARKADYINANIVLIPSDHDISEFMDIDPDTGKESISVDMYLKGNDTKNTPPSQLKAIKDYSLRIKSMIDEGASVALPLITYYGTERGQIKPVERRTEFNAVFPRWDIYKADSLGSATDFRRFFTWFERNEDLERRKKIELWDKTYTSHVLDAVRTALERFFEGKYANPRVEQHPLRFVMDDITDPDNIMETRIDRMSDGYRITIALVADIASRMAEANPSPKCSGLDDPLSTNGIVMIDEIDLHLHPTLQREVLGKLRNIFPNVQFIVSTHSPNVVMGALDFVQVVKLENGEIKGGINIEKYKKDDISMLLLSDLFGLRNVRTQEYQILSLEYEDLLKQPKLTEEQRQRVDELGAQLRLFTSADVDRLRKALSIIQKGHD